MTNRRDLKSLVRDRMEKTGERYAAARRNVVGEDPKPPRDDGAGLKGWIITGSSPRDYEFVVDPEGGREGRRAARVASCTAVPTGFGCLMQQIMADDYRGHRVRWSGYLKTEHVADWCGLWMRIDGHGKNILEFDNMQSRPRTGTTDWHRCEVVLDVAVEAQAVAFGVLITGAGTVWMADVALEIVGRDVPVTSSTRRAPQNLSFDE
jgi:hypothetical protein